MSTSSITANFYCDDAKAANAFVRVLCGNTPPRELVAKVDEGTRVRSYRNQEMERQMVQRFLAAARRRGVKA